MQLIKYLGIYMIALSLAAIAAVDITDYIHEQKVIEVSRTTTEIKLQDGKNNKCEQKGYQRTDHEVQLIYQCKHGLVVLTQNTHTSTVEWPKLGLNK